MTAAIISISYMVLTPLVAALLIAINRRLQFDATAAMDRVDRAADENRSYVITGAAGRYTAASTRPLNGLALLAVVLACFVAYQGGMVIPNLWSAPDGAMSLSTGARIVGAISGLVIGWQLTIWVGLALQLAIGIAALCLMLAIAAIGLSYITTGGAFTLYTSLLARMDGSAMVNKAPKAP